MLNKIKQAKRRVIQHTLESVGKAEVTARDEEFHLAVENFKAMEHDLNTILKALKEARELTNRYTARNASLSCLLAAYFRGEQGEESFRNPSNAYKDTMTHSHDVIQSSCSFLLQEQVINRIQTLLDETFQVKKKAIQKHHGLKTDLESYKRRVRSLQEKGKPGNDPEMIKFSTKLGRTESAYTRLHEDLLRDLRDIYQSRHDLLHSHFVTIVACQSELQDQLANDLKSVLEQVPNSGMNPIRDDIRSLVSAGGPPKVEEEEHASNGGSIIKGFTKKIKRASMRRTPAKNNQELGTYTPQKVPSGTYNNIPLPVPGESTNNNMSTPSQNQTSIPNAPTPDSMVDGSGNQYTPRDDSLDKQPTNQTSYPEATSPATTESQSFADDSSAHENPFSSPVGIPVAESYNSPTSVDNNVEETNGEMQNQTVASEQDDEVAIAIFEYNGLEEQDLSFSKGDRIIVERKIDEGWWSGRKEDGSVGLFPSNYVKIES